MKRLIYIPEAVKMFGLSEYSLRCLVREKKIRFMRAGKGLNGKLIFDTELLEADLHKLMAENMENITGKVRRVP